MSASSRASLRVVVTGGAGFIGSHITEHLISRGDDVTVLDDLSTGVAANVPAGARLKQVDITDEPALRAILADQDFDAVVHAAAQFSVPVSVREPERSARINVGGTANVIAVLRDRVRRMVFLSTGGAIYGETPRCASEDAPRRPVSPYGRQKLEAEELVRTSELAYAILRPANVYGRRQRSDLEGGVVAVFLQRFREVRELTVYGDGTAERDYVHVGDVAESAVAALDRSDSGTWNVGTGVPTSLLTLIDVMSVCLGQSATDIRHVPVRPGDLQRACVDPSKAIKDGLLRSPRTLRSGLTELLSRH